MAEFGKRGVRAAASSVSRSQLARVSGVQSAAPAPAEPTISDLIPQRDLRAIDKGTLPTWVNASHTQLVGLIALVPLILLGALTYYGPDLVRDLRHAATFAEARDLEASDGHCKRYMFLVTLCSANVTARSNGQVVQKVSFLMFFRGGGGAELAPVRAKADASVISIEYAVRDVLLNRTLSLLGLTAFCGWLTWLFVQQLRKGRYKGGPAHVALLDYLATKLPPA